MNRPGPRTADDGEVGKLSTLSTLKASKLLGEFPGWAEDVRHGRSDLVVVDASRNGTGVCCCQVIWKLEVVYSGRAGALAASWAAS